MPAVEINYLAVVVAALATFLIGGLWYSVLFGKLWMRLHGYTPEQLEEMKRKGTTRPYLGSLLAYLVMALVFSVLVDWTGVTTVASGACLGATIWLGFAATIGLTAILFSEKSLGVWLLDAAYQLVYLVVQGMILTYWS
jgi:hypothetical protein